MVYISAFLFRTGREFRSNVQEVPYHTGKCFRFLSLWPMPALLHDGELRVWNERMGSLYRGKRNGCILRAIHKKRGDHDLVQPAGEIAAQAGPADFASLEGDIGFSCPRLAHGLIDPVNEFLRKTCRVV